MNWRIDEIDLDVLGGDARELGSHDDVLVGLSDINGRREARPAAV
jgi:hypothetical protein